MSFNRQRYGYSQPQYGYSGQDIKALAYRHLTIAMTISAFIILAVNIIFYDSPTDPVLISLYMVGSFVEIGIILVLFFSFLFRKQFSESTATLLLNIFAVASSLSLAFIVDLYRNVLTNGMFIVTLTFGISAVVVFGMYAYTSANKPDTSSLQRIMFVVVIAFLVVSLLGFFIFSNSPIFYLLISGVGALIFAVYMYIDFARLERREFSSPAMMALMLFIDIIYFIQYLLQFLALFMGQSRR